MSGSDFSYINVVLQNPYLSSKQLHGLHSCWREGDLTVLRGTLKLVKALGMSFSLAKQGPELVQPSCLSFRWLKLGRKDLSLNLLGLLQFFVQFVLDFVFLVFFQGREYSLLFLIISSHVKSLELYKTKASKYRINPIIKN